MPFSAARHSNCSTSSDIKNLPSHICLNHHWWMNDSAVLFDLIDDGNN